MKVLTIVLGLFLMVSCGNSSKFTAPSSAKAGSEIIVKFTNPISSTDKSRCWITIAEKTKPDSDWGAWQYVNDKATSIKLICPDKAGEYEIRLHDMYPAKKSHVIERKSFTIN